jgi:hypothetical protein
MKMVPESFMTTSPGDHNRYPPLVVLKHKPCKGSSPRQF